MFAIERPHPRMIERVIVKAAKSFAPRVILPDPFSKLLLDAFLFFARRLGCLHIDNGLLVHIVIDSWRLEIQRLLDEFQPGVAVGSPIGCVGGRTFGFPVGGDVPRAECVDMPDLNTRWDAQQLVGKSFHVRWRQPGRAQPHVNFRGRQILRQNGLQRFDVFMKARVAYGGGFGGGQLFSDIAGKILVFGFPLLRLWI